MACVSHDTGTADPNVASLAAHQARRASERPGATPELLADVAAVAEVLTRIGASELPGTGVDSADTARRLARLSDHHEQLGRLGELMARIEAVSPESAGYWRVIGSTHRDMAAQMEHAALLIADAEIT
jgi:hypothetical protein